MLLKSISNKSVWHFHYNLFSGTLQTVKISREQRRHTKVPQVKILESYLQNWIRGMLYKFILGKRPKTTSFGKVSIWKFKFWSDLVKEEVVSRPGEGRSSE
jgi:hypothetical protein